MGGGKASKGYPVKQPSINWGNNGTSSRTIATTSKQGKIKKVYDKKDEKR